MAKVNIFDILYSEEKSALDFKFESLSCPNFYNFLTEEDIIKCYNIARSNKYAGNVKLKKQMIEDILKPRGFVRIFSGTNRLIFRYLENSSFVLKVGFDTSGLKDSLREMQNQYHLQPFVQKVFQVHPTGTVATCERVHPIRSIYEFAQVAEDVYELITKCIIGKYVLDDIGCMEFFQNYGIRPGFGVVLLDFPYMYELDGQKLYCNVKDKQTGHYCNGIIDYDTTFDNIICTKCGKRYFAKDLKSGIKNNLIYIKGEKSMGKVFIYKGKKLISVNGGNETEVIEREEKSTIPITSKRDLDNGFVIPDDEIIIDEELPIHQQNIQQPVQDDYSNQYNIESTFIPSYKEDNKIENECDDERDYVIQSEIKKEEPRSYQMITHVGKHPKHQLIEEINNKDFNSTDQNVEIPKNLGEIISINSIDDEDVDYSKFNISEKDFDEPTEEDITKNEEEIESFEKIQKINRKDDEFNDVY